jgi:hypothetical protein
MCASTSPIYPLKNSRNFFISEGSGLGWTRTNIEQFRRLWGYPITLLDQEKGAITPPGDTCD